jgi:membrane fusion protein (multidrug efflux system)
MERESTGNHRRKIIAVIVFSALAVVGAVAAYLYIRYISTHVSTDDAFVDGDVYTIAFKVSGMVKAVHVDSNQFVKKGDLLVELDPSDYNVRVDEAAAALSAEKSRTVEAETRIKASRRLLSELEARVEAQRATLDLHKANLEQAELDLKRTESLYGQNVITKERYEKTITAYKVALSQVKASAEGLKNAILALDTQNAVILEAESAKNSQRSAVAQREAVLTGARLNRGYTKVYAPIDGHITKKSVEVGNQIKDGQPLMVIVPIEGLYVTANYKETQLQNVRKGQRVAIKVDSYPGRTLEGRVDSIMAGTGSAFTLFPPENATGNYVKIVQRIPVKIVFDKETDRQHILRIGMSVVPTILVSEK